MSTHDGDMLSDAGNYLGDAGRSAFKAAGSRMDGAMDAASDTLEQGKERLRDGAREAGDSLHRAQRGATRAWSDSVDYFRASDARDMLSDVRNLARKHPGKSLMAVAAIGFFVGRALRKDD